MEKELFLEKVTNMHEYLFTHEQRHTFTAAQIS